MNVILSHYKDKLLHIIIDKFKKCDYEYLKVV